jgi:stage II sporulation protein D
MGLLLAAGCSRKTLPSVTSGMDESEDRWIRVLLFDNLNECTVFSYGGLVIEDGQTAAQVRLERPYQTLSIRWVDGGFQVGDYRFHDDIWIRPESPYVFEIEQIPFRGSLRLIRNAEGSDFLAVNYVPLESYLCGVVPAEMQSYWEPEALKAQAVVCRTYSLYIKHRFGPGRAWDLKRTQANQVYKGLSAETKPTNQAVFQTAGQVLVCKDSSGQKRLFPSYYSSVCGGHTENSRDVFGDSVKALEGVECPFCRRTARPEFYSWSGVLLDRKTLTERLQKRYPALLPLGQIQQIEPVRVSETGRISSLRLTGSTGQTAFLRGEDFRLSADPSGRRLKSTLFKIRPVPEGFEFTDGRGFGHGVGLCQSGAQALALQGSRYQEILAYYYPGSELVRLTHNP